MATDEPTSPAAAGDPTTAARQQQLGRRLLFVALVILLVASLRNISGPWERGLRGGVAARYTDVAVSQTLHYGLGVTLGLPAFIIEVDGKLQRNVNFHHPPYYWLYAAGWGWLLGDTPMALRIGQLFLFVPGLLALFLLVRRWGGPVAAGWASLLFATAPLVAYYGPMALQDGAVLGCGLLTLWRYQCFVDVPNLRNWLLTAALFFVSASWDFSGYWWGPAMFVLAFNQQRPLRAMLWVLSFVPVSVLAFATMAVHFGLDEKMGGPVKFVHELLALIRHESHGIEETVDFARFLEAMQLLWLDHFNILLLLLAIAGAAIAIVGDRRLRQLALLGAATLLPGLLNYGSMFRHAVDHAFWFMHGFAGLCVFAACVPDVGLGLLRAGQRTLQTRGRVLVVLSALVVIGGAIGTQLLITRWQNVETSDTAAVIRRALPYLDGCNTTMTSAPAITQVQIGHTSLVYAIDDAVKLQAFIDLGRRVEVKDKLGFVVHPQHNDQKMLDILDSLAKRVVVGDIFVYQLRL